MLLEIAVGDALGAGYEYNEQAYVENLHNLFGKYVQHGKHRGIKPGMYTDDTQMSIAIAEALLSGDEWTPHNITKYFINCFMRDQRDGYARRFQAFLEQDENHTPEGFLKNIRPESERSGAAMRAGPIGLMAKIEKVKEYATIQAEITHKTKAGVDSAVAAALAVMFFHHTIEQKKYILGFIEHHVPGYPWKASWRGKVGMEGINCVHAALTAVVENNSLTGILSQCISYRGDVDTVAAIAMAMASEPRIGGNFKQDLPQNLIDTLENGSYGKDYLIKLDEKLMDVYRKTYD